jgi:hypothetical protein
MRDPDMDLEDRQRLTLEALVKCWGQDRINEEKESGYLEREIEKHTQNDKYLLLTMDIDWNCEIEGKKMVDAVIDALNLDDVECVMEGY